MPTKRQIALRMRRCVLINVKSKKHKYFDVLAFADMYLGRPPGYVARVYAQGKKAHDYEQRRTFIVKIYDPNLSPEERFRQSQPHSSTQLCWDCKNACGKCSWSQSFIPVAGWVAEKTIINTQGTNGTNKKHFNRTISSYDIKACPLFQRG